MSCTTALDNTGTVYVWGAWGSGNGAGVSITGGAIASITGGSLAGKRVVSIASGDAFALALDSTGVVHAWGNNVYGQLGNSTTNNQTTPIAVTGGTLTGRRIVFISAGYQSSFAIDSEGIIHAWGANNSRQLGDGTTTQRVVPVRATFGSLFGRTFYKVLPYSSGQTLQSPIVNTTIALDTTGCVHNWGYSHPTLNQSILGQASNIYLDPVMVTAGNLYFNVDIAAGIGHAATMYGDGEMYIWGSNYFGQIGQNSISNNDGFNQRSTTYALASSQIPSGTRNTSGAFFVNFTGQHRCFVDGIQTINVSDYEGLIVVSDKNRYATLNGANRITITESLPLVSISKDVKNKKSFGVISLVSDATQLDDATKLKLKESGDIRLEINSIGEGAVWVCDEGGSLESGDYITTSSVPGYGMKQDDDILRNYTVAKLTMDCDFSGELINEEMIKKDEYGNNILDENGYPIWEQVMTQIITKNENDEEIVTNVPKMIPFYKMRYLDQEGNILTQADYNIRKEAGDQVYRAAFVGCTYHCG